MGYVGRVGKGLQIHRFPPCSNRQQEHTQRLIGFLSFWAHRVMGMHENFLFGLPIGLKYRPLYGAWLQYFARDTKNKPKLSKNPWFKINRKVARWKKSSIAWKVSTSIVFQEESKVNMYTKYVPGPGCPRQKQARLVGASRTHEAFHICWLCDCFTLRPSILNLET